MLGHLVHYRAHLFALVGASYELEAHQRRHVTAIEYDRILVSWRYVKSFQPILTVCTPYRNWSLCRFRVQTSERDDYRATATLYRKTTVFADRVRPR